MQLESRQNIIIQFKKCAISLTRNLNGLGVQVAREQNAIVQPRIQSAVGVDDVRDALAQRAELGDQVHDGGRQLSVDVFRAEDVLALARMVVGRQTVGQPRGAVSDGEQTQLGAGQVVPLSAAVLVVGGGQFGVAQAFDDRLVFVVEALQVMAEHVVLPVGERVQGIGIFAVHVGAELADANGAVEQSIQ